MRKLIAGIGAGLALLLLSGAVIHPQGVTLFNLLYRGRSVAAKLGDTVSVKDFGAVGDGVTDDTAAIQAAIAYALSAPQGGLGGPVVYFPKPSVVYRVTNTITVGGPKWLDEADIRYDGTDTYDYTLVGSYNPTARAAASLVPLISLVGDAGTAIWGNFTSLTPKAIIYYTGFGSIQDNNKSLAAARISGLTILGNEAMSGTSLATIDYTLPLNAGNHQVGIAYAQSPVNVDHVVCQEMDVCLLTIDAYWTQVSDVRAKHVNTAFYLNRMNAVNLSNLSAYYAKSYAGIISGTGLTMRGLNTEQCANDYWFPYGSSMLLEGGYLEAGIVGDTGWSLIIGDAANTGSSNVTAMTISEVKARRTVSHQILSVFSSRLTVRRSTIADASGGVKVLDANSWVKFEDSSPTFMAGDVAASHIHTRFDPTGGAGVLKIEGGGITADAKGTFQSLAINGTNATIDTGGKGIFQGGLQTNSFFILKRVVLTFGATITPNVQSGSEHVITPPNGNVWTFNAPINPVTGARITVRVVNTFGVLGAVTWNAVYKMSAWTQPANGFSRAIDFQYDGTNWIEVSRTPADVPN